MVYIFQVVLNSKTFQVTIPVRMDYIKAFDKVLYYNNERHKHTWFIKVMFKSICRTNSELVTRFTSSLNFQSLEFLNGSQKWDSLRNKFLAYTEPSITFFGIN
ncbi:hypothetical protein H5410_041152 [Solanum commersonii]|uniref:Uncharacterized protein n=1 Tax=Solanum commersonii TaxID=4109 RepID=A0A9J5XUM6_SOLCO|nr:hypothetical protein H5410_041152 [Solanum commersonii]